MPYIGKKPADIIATAVDTTTGTFSGDLTVDTSTLYVDSANNRVGVGTVSPSTKLEINGGTDNNIVRIVSTDANANIEFADNTTTSGLQIGANGDNMKFGISGAEVMRINSSGNVGIGVIPESWDSAFSALQVGGTGALRSDASANATDTVGVSQNAYYDSANSRWEYLVTDEASDYYQQSGTHNWRVAPSGSADAAITWTTAMTINNSGNVGIGTSPSNKLEVHSGDATNIVAKSTNGNGGYLNYSGLSSGGTTTFSVTHNGKIYAADGIQLGGTGSANHLDDYEEGTWTPVFKDNNSTTVATSQLTAKYRKVGELVTVEFTVQRNNSSSLTGTLYITGLPFTTTNIPALRGQMWVDNITSDVKCFIYVGSSNTEGFLPLAGTTDSVLTTNQWANGRYIYGQLTYLT